VATENPQAEVERLDRAEAELSGRLAGLRVELAAAEVAAGEAALALALGGSAPAKTETREVAQLRAGIEATERAIDAARLRRQAAMPRVWLAEAAALRAEAKRKVQQADDIDRQCQPHLKKLAELQGVRFVPESPARPYPSAQAQGGAPFVVVVPTPKTELLRQQAAALEGQATSLERKAADAATTGRSG
jgi:hypothetical protein